MLLADAYDPVIGLSFNFVRRVTMALRKMGNSWQIDYIDPGGKRIRKCFKNRKEAAAELGKRVSLIAEGRYLDVKKDCKTIFKELTDKYEENFKHQKSFVTWKKHCLKNFKEHFGDETRLVDIRYVNVETYRNYLRQKPTPSGAPRTDASVNRELSCLRHLFSKAIEWELMEESPFRRGRSLILKENNHRLRYLSEEEILRLLAACPSHLRNIVICALYTGMRRGEILGLKWSQIRNGFIYLQKTKTDEPRQIPVNDALEVLFQNITKAQQIGSEHVFIFSRKNKRKEMPTDSGLKVINTVVGHFVGEVKTSFYAALKRAGIKNFRFHDLRHTFASHMIMRGGSLKAVQEILAHKTMTMTLRYAHLSQEHKKTAVNLLNGLAVLASMSKNVNNDASVDSDLTDKEKAASQVCETASLSGGPHRDRTCDPLIKSQLLYQLS